jgi:hypothetical protein
VALLVDGSWCEVDDLQAYDVSATTVADEEGIDLAAKMSLSEAWITDRVDAFVRWESTLKGQNAVVSEPLKRWHLANVLAMLYRDASFSQVNDRYEKKWKVFQQDAAERKAEYFLAGVPYVGNPVRQPSAPAVTVIVGVQPAAAYSIAVTRVDEAGRESAPSDLTAVQAPAGNGITVSANGLVASDRWNVYATNGEEPLRKQNSDALSAIATWSLPAIGLSAGQEAGDGQAPDGWVRQRRILPRG